jgi:hypothetical protein
MRQSEDRDRASENTATSPLTDSRTMEDNFASQKEEEIKMHQEVFADKEFPNDWRVEAIDKDSGDIFVAVFSGPDAEERAREYADWQTAKRGKRPVAA